MRAESYDILTPPSATHQRRACQPVMTTGLNYLSDVPSSQVDAFSLAPHALSLRSRGSVAASTRGVRVLGLRMMAEGGKEEDPYAVKQEVPSFAKVSVTGTGSLVKAT